MAKIQKNIRETPEFSEYRHEIEYVIECMGEDIRRLDRNFEGFPTMNDYRERVIADTDQILRNIDGMAELEKGDIAQSTKKSKPAPKSFNDMVKSQRTKNRIGKSNWQDSGSVAFENLPTPESLAKSIWGDLTCLIADACDNASFNTDTEVEICAGLACDYYSRVAEALIPMLQNFIDENKWR